MRLDPPRRRLITLLLAVAAIVVVLILVLGGGEESSDEAARTSAEEFVGAITEGDFETACGMLTEALRTQIGGEECPDELAATVGQAGGDLEIEVLEVRVSGPQAVAETRVRTSQGPAIESSFDMQLEGETWQVSRLGSS
jgi:hypothetical protein